MKILEVIDVPHFNQAARKQAADILKRDCQPFLQAVGNDIAHHILYRGINRTPLGKLITKHKCPVGRDPIDTPELIHLAADEWFSEHTGIQYRSNSIFCTGNMNIAKDYGYLYAVFPIGHFDFCFSPIIADMTSALDDIDIDAFEAEEDWGDYSDAEEEDIKKEEQLQKIVWDVLDSGRYQHNTSIDGFLNAMKSQSEIMIHCGSYYLVAIDGPTLYSIQEYL